MAGRPLSRLRRAGATETYIIATQTYANQFILNRNNGISKTDEYWTTKHAYEDARYEYEQVNNHTLWRNADDKVEAIRIQAETIRNISEQILNTAHDTINALRKAEMIKN